MQRFRPKITAPNLACVLLIAVATLGVLQFCSRRPQPDNVSSSLAHFSRALLLYLEDHSNQMPSSVMDLEHGHYMTTPVLQYLSANIVYLVAGESETNLPRNAVVAMQRFPDGSGYRSVLLVDGNVTGVPERLVPPVLRPAHGILAAQFERDKEPQLIVIPK